MTNSRALLQMRSNVIQSPGHQSKVPGMVFLPCSAEEIVSNLE